MPLLRGDRDDGDDAVGGDQRDVGRALRPGRNSEPRAHPRVADVVHGERRRLAHCGRDPGRLLQQIDPDVAPPFDVLAVGAREIARRLPPVLRDERERREVDAEENADLVEEGAGDTLDVGRARELGCDAAQAFEATGPLGDRRLVPPGSPEPERRADAQTYEQRSDGRGEALPRHRETDEPGELQLNCGHAGRRNHTGRRGRRRTFSVLITGSARLVKMGRTAHCSGTCARLPS